MTTITATNSPPSTRPQTNMRSSPNRSGGGGALVLRRTRGRVGALGSYSVATLNDDVAGGGAIDVGGGRGGWYSRAPSMKLSRAPRSSALEDSSRCGDDSSSLSASAALASGSARTRLGPSLVNRAVTRSPVAALSRLPEAESDTEVAPSISAATTIGVGVVSNASLASGALGLRGARGCASS